MEAEGDVPPGQGGDQVPGDVLAAVPLVLTTGPAVLPVQLNHPLTVLDDLVGELGQHGEGGPRQPGPPPDVTPDQLRPPAPEPVENEAVQNVTKAVGIEEMLRNSGNKVRMTKTRMIFN